MGGASTVLSRGVRSWTTLRRPGPRSQAGSGSSWPASCVTMRSRSTVSKPSGSLGTGIDLELRTLRQDRKQASTPSGSLQAPMPGTVLIVQVENGDLVQEGDVLIVLESMKMELSIAAPHAGVVSGLSLRPGDRVELGQSLVAVIAPAGTLRTTEAQK